MRAKTPCKSPLSLTDAKARTWANIAGLGVWEAGGGERETSVVSLLLGEVGAVGPAFLENPGVERTILACAGALN